MAVPPVSHSSGHSTERKRQSPLSALQFHLVAPLIQASSYRVWFETLPSSGLASREKGPFQGTLVTTGSVQFLCGTVVVRFPSWSSSNDSMSTPCWCRPDCASTGTDTVIWVETEPFAGITVVDGRVIQSSPVLPKAVQSTSILTGSSERCPLWFQIPRKRPSLASSKGSPTLTSAFGPLLHQ